MTRDGFHHELQELEEAVVQMATLVEAAIASSVQALIQRDVELAQQVIDGDNTVNEHQRAIRNKTFGVMARQAPVARDLRELVTIQLVVSELERMGDHAAGVAKNAIRLAAQAPVKAAIALPEMAKLIRQQVRDAIQAFVDVNIVAAREICARDDEVDLLYRQTFDELLACMRDAGTVPQATSLLFVAHDLERIGDYAANVAKRSIVLAQFSLPYSLAGLAHMARLVQAQLKSIIDALGDNDAEKAVEVWRSDQVVDDIYNALFRELITYMMEDPRNITPCTHLLFIAKNLERIGDHATNIAENLYYAVKGETLPDSRPKGDTSAFAVVRPRE